MAVRGVLHGVNLSPFVRKVRAALAFKGIDYELVNVMPGAMDADFLAISPLSKIPVWQEDGWTLPDSSVICAYLERIQPEPALYPSDARVFAKELFWEEYADTRLVDSSTPVFFQRIVRERVFKQRSDETLVRRQLDDVLPPVFDQIEKLFIPEADGSRISIASLSIWAPFVNLDHSGVELDAATWPGIVDFLAKMNAQPLLKALLEEERGALSAS